MRVRVCEDRGRAGYDFTPPTAAFPPTILLAHPPVLLGGGSPTFPPQDASEAQLVRLPRHVPVELFNNGGSGPWHKEIVFFFFSWGSRGGRSVGSPVVTGGWGSQLCFSRVHHRFTSGILGGKGNRKRIRDGRSCCPGVPASQPASPGPSSEG